MGIRTLPFFKGKKGFQMAGGGYDSGGGSYTLPTASASTLGGVKIGSNISIDADGAISAPDTLEEKATLPTASADELGNRYIYTGETSGGLTKGYVYECVSDDGDPATYSWAPSNVQAPYTLPTASDSTLGGVKVGDGLGMLGDVLSTNIVPIIPEYVDGRNHVVFGLSSFDMAIITVTRALGNAPILLICAYAYNDVINIVTFGTDSEITVSEKSDHSGIDIIASSGQILSSSGFKSRWYSGL